MPNVHANVGLNNYAQSGDQTLQQIQSGVAAATGVNPGVAEQVRDPATGKLVKVVLTMPDNAAAQASAVIAANKGVATTAIAAPQFSANDLDDTAGIAYSGTLIAGQYINVLSDDYQMLGYPTLGEFNSTGYVDHSEEVSAYPLFISFLNGSGSELTIPSGATLTLTLSNGAELSIVRTNNIVVSTSSDKSYWVAADGKLYLRLAPGGVGGVVPYDQAIQNPPA